MQKFINSSISIRRNRFKETGPKFDDISINQIDIGNSFESMNNSPLLYTNYAKSSEQKIYNIVKNIYSKIFNNEINVFDEYQSDELYYKSDTIDRLLNIINKSNNSSYTKNDLQNIYKLKHKDKPKIHLYIKIDNGSVLILLIDLFHLSLPADVYVNGKLAKRSGLKDLSNVYSKHKDNTFNLNNIIIS